MAVCGSEDDSGTVLRLALDLARRRQQNLLVVLQGSESERGSQEALIRTRLEGSGLAVDFEGVQRFEDLVALVRRRKASLLILGNDSTLIRGRDEELVDLGCPVLLTRGDASESGQPD